MKIKKIDLPIEVDKPITNARTYYQIKINMSRLEDIGTVIFFILLLIIIFMSGIL